MSIILVMIIIFIIIIIFNCKNIFNYKNIIEYITSTVISTHNAGFFSCCSIKLNDIINYINTHSKIPDYVDSSKQFDLYKKDKKKDITYDYFEHYDNIIIVINYPINYHEKHQFINYSDLNYKNIVPIVKKYFSPSTQIINIVEKIKQKYNINYDNTIAVYYRGTDKIIETQISSFENFYNKIKEISDLDVNKYIIIQTDTAPFIDYINSKNLKNIIIFNENSTSYSNVGIHNEKTNEENYNDMLNLFSIFLIISKCKYIICSSGNCSLWMMLYRENNKNVYQFLNDEWYSK